MLIATCLEDIEDALPPECIAEICTSGSNDIAVDEWLTELNISISENFDLKEVLSYYGLDTKTISKDDFLGYVLWIAAWNRFENDKLNQESKEN